MDSNNENVREPLLKRISNDAHHLSGTEEFAEILELSLDESLRIVRAEKGDFYFFDDKGELAPFLLERDEEALRIAKFCVEHKCSFNIAPNFVDSTSSVPAGIDLLSHLAPTRAYICVYLGLQDSNIGVILLQVPRYSKRFYEADLSHIRGFAATFSILLKNSWLVPGSSEISLNFKSSLLLLLENASLNHRVRDASYQLKTVLEVSNLINSTRELSELIQAVLISAQKVLRAENSSLFLLDETTGELYFEIVAGKEKSVLKGMRIPRGQGIVGLCFQEGRSIVVNDALTDERVYRGVDEISKITTRNILASPLILDGRPIGVIEVINTVDRSSFTSTNREVFESFSASVAIAIQRRRLLDDLQKTNVQLEKKLSEVTSLHSVAAVLVEARNNSELFLRVLRIIRRDLEVNRVMIIIQDDQGQLRIGAREGAFVGGEEEIKYYYRVAREALRDVRPLMVSDLSTSSRFASLKNDYSPDVGSCIMIPLTRMDNEVPFMLLFVADPISGLFLDEDYRLLITIGSQLVRGFENFRLTDELLKRQAIEKEVEITSRIQQNILPTRIPQHMHMDLAARSVMAKTTGGDFYDYYVHEPNGDVTMLVADVSGKSLPAALFMAISNSILRTIIRSKASPVEILTLANDYIYEESETGMFVTVFLARYQPSTGILKYASAGHNEMLLVRQDGTYEVLSGRGAPLGVIPSFKQKYSGGEISILEDDLLVLYTDGIVESFDSKDEEYGLDRLIEKLQRFRDWKPDEIIQRIYEDVMEHSGGRPQYDDFTMLVSRIHGTILGVRKYHISLPAAVESIPLLRDFLTQVSQRHGLFGKRLEDILLSSDEAATNIVLHAYADTVIEYPTFECDVRIDSGHYFQLELRDRGRPFDVKDVRAPDLRENIAGRRKGGFGVYLIRSLMDRVEYGRVDDTNFIKAEMFLSLDNDSDLFNF